MTASDLAKRVTLAAFTAVILFSGRPAWSDEEHPVPSTKEGSIEAMAKFYTGGLVKTGRFPGQIVCLRCDLKPGAGAAARCAKEGHRHALSMEDDSMIHPLLGGSEQVLKQINSAEIHGKNVTVYGNHYPDTGLIFVERIDVQK